MKSKEFFALLLFVAVSEFAGLIGSLFTTPAIPKWYAGLQRSALNPPSWVFAPVWTTLFVLMGVAAFLVWRERGNRREVKNALSVFGLQLALNALWSVIFFGWRSPSFAFLEIILLWLAIIWTTVLFYRISRPAAYLFVPYLLWVTFAAYLNFAVAALNF